ncbi:hypothetical protein [Mucilaginibacter sp. dw_454]|uniref:hypothetical protein n=1 Tax=Mucilaginibacter sp. dw_454 TaxID=2720079 RepID=UPI001BD4E650|nr:hypothetical protein [Mucilaginibacter sp. dw_454]
MKKYLYWFAGLMVSVILLLAITNPSMRDFKRFVKSKGFLHTVKIERKGYVFFSIYEAYTGDGFDEWGSKYVGVFDMFIEYSTWTA